MYVVLFMQSHRRAALLLLAGVLVSVLIMAVVLFECLSSASEGTRTKNPGE